MEWTRPTFGYFSAPGGDTLLFWATRQDVPGRTSSPSTRYALVCSDSEILPLVSGFRAFSPLSTGAVNLLKTPLVRACLTTCEPVFLIFTSLSVFLVPFSTIPA